MRQSDRYRVRAQLEIPIFGGHHQNPIVIRLVRSIEKRSIDVMEITVFDCAYLSDCNFRKIFTTEAKFA